MACTGGGRMEAELSHIDSLTEADQSAAIAHIDSITTASGGGMARSVRMRLALLRAKACNKLLLPLNRDSLLMLDDYFTDHGTPNERMLTKYIIGCSYVVNKNAPTALEYFHEAADMADTTSVNCDWRTLHKVHVQAGMLLFSQDALHDADEEYKMAYKYAMKAKDTLNALITVEQKANIYMLEGKTDSCIQLRMKLHDLYMKHGYAENAAMSLGPVIDNLAKMGKLDEAKHYLDSFEKNSGLFDSLGNIEKGREIHYYIKGMYYFEAGRLDSAEHLFRKCISSAVRRETVLSAYKGLMHLYKKLDNPDSVAKYAELARVTQDTVNIMKATQHLQQMHAMYNYDQHVEMAEKESAYIKALGTAVALILLLVIIYMVGYILRKRRLRLAEVARYERNIDELKKVQREYEILTENREARISSLLEEKSKEIERLQREKAEYEKKNNTVGQTRFHDAPIIKVLADHARRSHKCMTVAECAELVKLFSGYTPLSQWQSRLSDSEYHVCLLVRAGFSPADIGILTQQSPSNISNIRKRLYLKMTGMDGSPKDFDKYIKSL